uniref:Uncharacterized protein n=1 Tax=Lynx canadensis TaxID=61383 RepID=A0A667GGP4_LYNCA
MERDGQQLSARPALETEGLRFLHVTGEWPRVAGWSTMAGTSSSAASFSTWYFRAFHPTQGPEAETAGPSCGCSGLVSDNRKEGVALHLFLLAFKS